MKGCTTSTCWYFEASTLREPGLAPHTQIHAAAVTLASTRVVPPSTSLTHQLLRTVSDKQPIVATEHKGVAAHMAPVIGAFPGATVCFIATRCSCTSPRLHALLRRYTRGCKHEPAGNSALPQLGGALVPACHVQPTLCFAPEREKCARRRNCSWRRQSALHTLWGGHTSLE